MSRQRCLVNAVSQTMLSERCSFERCLLERCLLTRTKQSYHRRSCCRFVLFIWKKITAAGAEPGPHWAPNQDTFTAVVHSLRLASSYIRNRFKTVTRARSRYPTMSSPKSSSPKSPMPTVFHNRRVHSPRFIDVSFI